MDIKKRVIELTTQMSEINYDSEEDNLIKDSVSEIANYKNVESEDVELDYNRSSLRNINADISLTGDLYEGKPVSRKSKKSDDDEFNSDFENNLDSEGDVEDGFENETDDLGGEEDEETDDDGVGSDRDAADTSSSSQKKGSVKELSKNEDYNIYSSGTRNIKDDIKKGSAIKNQLGLWESLLECRIKLQKSLVASNKLPQKNNLVQLKNLFTADNKLMVEKSNKSITNLLGKLVLLQRKLLDQCPEYKSKTKNAMDENTIDEEIPSCSGSENDDDNDEDQEEPPRKKLKLHEYPEVLRKKYEEYIPYRNMSIQKWNDKTKIASGKMASSNFSAFDHSTLKQIEQIMSDKERLINRTQIRRSQYRVLGTAPSKEDSSNQENHPDKEIFDDDDFYHKLLRDFIERRSVEGSSATQTERQWMELQKLRSKMKKKVDTKSTKGRKIRYIVIPKLVNFMAPVPYSTWNENAENELYNSLFGKIISR